MAAINFPSNPSIGDTYSYSGKIWLWNGKFWTATNTRINIGRQVPGGFFVNL